MNKQEFHKELGKFLSSDVTYPAIPQILSRYSIKVLEECRHGVAITRASTSPNGTWAVVIDDGDGRRWSGCDKSYDVAICKATYAALAACEGAGA